MRLPGAIAGVPAGRPARHSSGASGYMVGTVQLTDPDKYRWVSGPCEKTSLDQGMTGSRDLQTDVEIS
jgi:hypothetical protein